MLCLFSPAGVLRPDGGSALQYDEVLVLMLPKPGCPPLQASFSGGLR